MVWMECNTPELSAKSFVVFLDLLLLVVKLIVLRKDPCGQDLPPQDATAQENFDN
jgi:hypothetical protein